MRHDSLPQLRHQLHSWLQHRLACGRLPFRRVEAVPSVLTDGGLATPDLVLWINRDSLLAGAVIFTPAQLAGNWLEAAGMVAASLGLRQFVTWETRAVNLWDASAVTPQRLKSLDLPTKGAIDNEAFAITCEQLVQELKGLAVGAALPAEQLPAAYFANLCRQVLRDVEPSLREAARLIAREGEHDSVSLRKARDKGWLTLWRLLTLLQHERIPPGVRPERLDRALGYALAELHTERFRHLAATSAEPTLPEATAVRFYQLGGRLTQLGWPCGRERARASLRLLFAEAARDCEVVTTPLQPPPDDSLLLVNHLPSQTLAGATVVAAWPCLAGLALIDSASPDQMVLGVAKLPANCKPRRIVAVLSDTRWPLPTERRQHLTALRQPWPYRRFRLPSTAPNWLWDALHLGGLADPGGILQLTLPPDWVSAPGAELLWQALRERLTLESLQVYADGRQTLTMRGDVHTHELMELRRPDGTSFHLPVLPSDAELGELEALALTAGVVGPEPPSPRKQKARPMLAAKIAAKVFRDGLPNFPEHYLRRFDLPPLRIYDLPGPLQADSHFFDRVRLTAADGSWVDADNPVDAEALLLSSRDGRPQVALPSDPVLTARLIAAYRDDLQRLWQELLAECRRHRSGQRNALTLARRLWRERSLPTPGDPGG